MEEGNNTFTRFREVVMVNELPMAPRLFKYMKYVGYLKSNTIPGHANYKHKPLPFVVSYMANDIPKLQKYRYMQSDIHKEYINVEKYDNKPDPKKLDLNRFGKALMLMLMLNEKQIGKHQPLRSFDGITFNPKAKLTHMWRRYMRNPSKKDAIEYPGPEIDYFYDRAHIENLFIASTVSGKDEMLSTIKVLMGECRIFINVDVCLELFGKRLLNPYMDSMKYQGPGSPFMCGFAKQHAGLEDFLEFLKNWINNREYKVEEDDVSKWDSRMSWLLFIVCMMLAYVTTDSGLRNQDLFDRLKYYYTNICRCFIMMKDGYLYQKFTGNNSGSASTTHDNNIGVRTIEYYDLVDMFDFPLDVSSLIPILDRWNTTGDVYMLDFTKILTFYFRNRLEILYGFNFIHERIAFMQYSDDNNKIVTSYFKDKTNFEHRAHSYDDFGCILDATKTKVYNSLSNLTFLGFQIKEIYYNGKLMHVPTNSLFKAKHSLYFGPKSHRPDILFQVLVSLMIETYFDEDDGVNGYDYFFPMAEYYRKFRSHKLLISADPQIEHLLMDIPSKELVLRLYVDRTEGGLFFTPSVLQQALVKRAA